MKEKKTKIKNQLLNLKKSQYKEGADLILENAENLLDIAKTCHQKGLSGNGTSILITSLEELSKAAYLKIKAHNPHVVIKELENFFNDHKVKHKAIIRLVAKSISDNFKNKSDEDKDKLGLVIFIGIAITLFIAYNNEHTFNLEKIRQKGYYVDFNYDKSCWQSPKELITSESFSKYISIVENIFCNVKKDLFAGELTDVNTKQFIADLYDDNVYFRKTYKTQK